MKNRVTLQILCINNFLPSCVHSSLELIHTGVWRFHAAVPIFGTATWKQKGSILFLLKLQVRLLHTFSCLSSFYHGHKSAATSRVCP